MANDSRADDGWPNHPLKLIVAAAAGTPNDVWGRRVAERLTKSLGQPVVLENKPGAGGTIGAAAAASAPADGYTLFLGSSAELTIAPNFYRDLPYSVERSFAPITRFLIGRSILVAYPGLGVHSTSELIALAKTSPGLLTGGSYGNGTVTHLLLEELNRAAGISVTHVPYKNGSQAITDVIAGHTSLMFDWETTSGGFIRAGKLTPLLVVGPKRKPSFPEVPTAAEAGLPDLDIWGWNAFLAPAGTPQAILERLHRELVPILNSPDYLKIAAEYGSEIATTTPDDLAALIQSEQKKRAALVRTIEQGSQ